MGKYRHFRALLIRLTFVIHSVIGVWLIVGVKDDKWYWYLISPTFFMILETVTTLTLRRNLEWRW